MGIVWVIIGVVVVLGLLSAGNRGSRKPETDDIVRIDHPHVIDDDDSECTVCHKRFRENTMTCPYCGARFTARVEDSEEWDEEEDELEAWDEEDDK